MHYNFLRKVLSILMLVTLTTPSIVTPVNAAIVQDRFINDMTFQQEQSSSSITTEETEDILKENTAEEITQENIADSAEKKEEESNINKEKTDKNTTKTTTDEENIITPRWRVTDHKEEQCAYVISKLGLNANQQSWIKDGVGAPDKNYHDVAGFHAKQNPKRSTNYLACLKAIFMFAQLIGTNGNISKKQQILNSMPKIDASTKSDISEMIEKMNAYFDSKGSTTENQRKYIAYGFGLHLLGDMYAHRIMVKEANLNKWIIDKAADSPTNKYLQKRDFLPGKVEQVKADIKANIVNTGSLKYYMPEKDSGYNFILNFPIDGKKTTQNPGLVYPDNPTFMPKRFNAVKNASVSFVQKVRSGSSFNNVDLFLDNYNLSLHNYSSYKASIS